MLRFPGLAKVHRPETKPEAQEDALQGDLSGYAGTSSLLLDSCALCCTSRSCFVTTSQQAASCLACIIDMTGQWLEGVLIHFASALWRM